MQAQKKYDQLTLDFEPHNIRPHNYSGDFRKIKKVFENLRNDGEFVQCPCCEKKYNAIYKRPLYKSVVKALISQSKGSSEITSCSVSDYAKLRFWGLIRSTEKQGVWHITELGWDFLQGKISVPKHVILQNNVKIGESDERVTIHEVEI